MSNHPSGGFEILEHTADVGVRSWGPSVEEAFRQATLGLLDIVGAFRPGSGKRQDITVEARDLGGLLVDWLSEVLYVQEVKDVVFGRVEVSEVRDGRATGWVEVIDRPVEIEGTAVKAVTYHQLAVEAVDSRWVATVYLDI